MVKGDDGSLYMGNREGFNSHTDVVAMPFSRYNSTPEATETPVLKLIALSLNSRLETRLKTFRDKCQPSPAAPPGRPRGSVLLTSTWWPTVYRYQMTSSYLHVCHAYPKTWLQGLPPHL